MKLPVKSVLLMCGAILTGCTMMTDDSSFSQAVPAINVNQETTMQSVAPETTYHFPTTRQPTGSKTIIVDPNEHAWGAYDADGYLVAEGPASTGKGYCPDLGRACKTPAGSFMVYRKGGAECKSSIFPIPEGGAPMPYCMFFNGGYALHGSDFVPNYNASHGCVRLRPSDAQWLSDNFVTVGTKVQILPY
ncbi:MAG: enhA [Gammaproteobacteria bacterium]|jgi:lipoprotein-anchoring transpeptidase ErfK/SrfK|nr:enhA [Gammaproteobacteria bacterium]